MMTRCDTKLSEMEEIISHCPSRRRDARPELFLLINRVKVITTGGEGRSFSTRITHYGFYTIYKNINLETYTSAVQLSIEDSSATKSETFLSLILYMQSQIYPVTPAKRFAPTP